MCIILRTDCIYIFVKRFCFVVIKSIYKNEFQESKRIYSLALCLDFLSHCFKCIRFNHPCWMQTLLRVIFVVRVLTPLTWEELTQLNSSTVVPLFMFVVAYCTMVKFIITTLKCYPLIILHYSSEINLTAIDSELRKITVSEVWLFCI